MNPVNFGTLSAIRSAREVVDVPLIAAGGIVDGLSVQIAGLLGAEGVYCGSRFVACTEAPTHESIKQLYVDTTSDQLVQVAGIFGPVRSIHTPVIDKCLELMANPKENAGIITGTYAAGYKTAMLDGDLEHGLLDCGGAIDNIKDILLRIHDAPADGAVAHASGPGHFGHRAHSGRLARLLRRRGLCEKDGRPVPGPSGKPETAGRGRRGGRELKSGRTAFAERRTI